MRKTIGLLLFIALAAPARDEGDLAPDFTLKDVEGKEHALAGLKGKKGVVLLFTGIQCPRSTAAEPRLCAMSKKYGEKGVVFLAINSNWHESAEEIADYTKRSGFTIPVLKDTDNKVADRYGVDVQPTAVFLDGELRIRYRGLIDDHKLEDFVRNHYLRDAIEAVLAGREVAAKKTEPVGCSVKKVATESKSDEITYAKHVAPILYKSCVSCHRSGQVGPFSLETYDQARAWAREITGSTKRRDMPPWKPVSNHGEYENERRLTDAEIAILEKWSKNGAPKGDPKDLPPRLTFSIEWMLGKPDAVLKVDGTWELGATGGDEYRCYVLKNPFDEDKWITGIEYRPGNMRVVHHIIGYLDKNGASIKFDDKDPKTGYKSNGAGPNFIPSGSIGGWAPGNMPRMLPKGVGRLLRKGEHIVLETHYHRSGRAETDAGTSLAIYFAREPVTQKFEYHPISNFAIAIPPGVERHKVSGSWRVPRDVDIQDVMPHMHLLGREVSIVATLPDNTTKDLVVIKDWDFNWQETYQFKKPLRLPKGTRIRMEVFFDNSDKNPNNPSHPPKWVYWGEETTDEMAFGFIGYTSAEEK